jgi:hypothetical protein
MYQYVIIDRNKTKLSNLGITGVVTVFPEESILGLVEAATRAKAIKVAQDRTGLNDLMAIAKGSPSLFKPDLEVAFYKGVLGSQQPGNNLKGAGRKPSHKKVVRLELRLSDRAYYLLQQQDNKAGFVAELIEVDTIWKDCKDE